MSPVELRKRPCHPVKFKGQGPQLPHDTVTAPSTLSNRPNMFCLQMCLNKEASTIHVT